MIGRLCRTLAVAARASASTRADIMGVLVAAGFQPRSRVVFRAVAPYLTVHLLLCAVDACRPSGLLITRLMDRVRIVPTA